MANVVMSCRTCQHSETHQMNRLMSCKKRDITVSNSICCQMYTSKTLIVPQIPLDFVKMIQRLIR